MNIRFCLLLLSFGMLMSCDGGDDRPEPAMSMYEVTLLNATSNQPLSPLAAALHSPGYPAWQVGAPASTGLERLAEGGAAMPFLQELAAGAITATGAGAIPPGSSETVTLSAAAGEPVSLTVASMLVNTNDGFAGVTDLGLDHLHVAEVYWVQPPIYDAGTEMNSEGRASIPGPAAGGEGYSSARDDVGFVSMHPGVVSADDGLTESALNESHRFASASIMLKIVRTQ